MPGTDDKLLGEIAARVYRDDPRFARALRAGRPCPPREYRRTRAWLLLTFALLVLGTGITLAHGLLIVTGMVLAGMAGELCDPRRGPRRQRVPPPRS
ncbi:DUF3040 domain-containing protein [Streptomyces sp. NPDC088337]|uniref:DUF3040 domain-containing protein n=1 Tax=unclassified Streptomyces TaxID=2593676 RepID=UPI000C277BE6|nr:MULTISPECIES: DUF3040 domain-containing protein [unclassified Streptomyces]PJM93238.1 hypothetical protein CG719_24735 [Streptomyces sp. CB01373]WSB30665.1 DUF3040 domain-containing protein [Streptomyces sp. NBC_01788]